MGIKNKAAGFLLAAFAAVASLPSLAQTNLSFVKTPSAALNSEAHNGLQALGTQISRKTAVDIRGVTGIDIEHDDISLLPFIYWPVTNGTQPLSEQAQRKVQTFINTGGMIVFDTGYVNGDVRNVLAQLLGNVTIRPLVPMDKDHTLTRSFYLVADLKGSRNGMVWVEAPGLQAGNNVSSVVIGEKMWARSWLNLTGYEGRDPEKDQVLRSGINMIIYALTGNYKEDQIHTPSLLERLAR